METFNFETFSLFPIPVIKVKIDIEKIEDFFYSKIIHTDNILESPDGLLSHYHNNDHVLSLHEELQPLSEEILKNANIVYKELLNYTESSDLKFTNSWFNLADIGATQIKHIHSNCVLSGTLYLNVDERSTICFYSPKSIQSTVHNTISDEAVQEENEHGLTFHYNEANIQLENGDCLFWPSYLQHGYVDNPTPSRLSLSFNLLPERTNSLYKIS